MKNFPLAIGVIILASMLLLSGCAAQGKPTTEKQNVTSKNLSEVSAVSVVNISGGQKEATQNLVKFKNSEDLAQWLAANGGSATQSAGYGVNFAMDRAGATGAPVPAMAVAEGAVAKSATSAPSLSYSKTNVQIEGVDEADFVKTDGNSIFIVSGSNLVIVDAKTMKVLSTTKIAQPKDIFINGDKLVLFADDSKRYYYVEKYDIEPREYYKPLTVARIFDISNREKPKELSNITISGYHYQSRMIGDKVYLVTQEGVNYGPIIPQPLVMEGAKSIMPEIYYFDNPEQNYQFNTIASIDLANQKVVDSKTLMLGYSNTLMMSENNIYIAYQKSNYWPCRFCFYYQSDYDKERFYNVILPRLKGELKIKIDSVVSKNADENQTWKEISDVLAAYYTKMLDSDTMKAENKAMFDDITSALEEYDSRKAVERSKTVIHRLKVNDGQITYVGKGEVAGTLLNQFSMDESDGNLRVATTVSAWGAKRIQYNNVFVLDGQMKTIGSAERIAPDEQIYSARFMGNKLYLVTFRQTDPFFVIDLSRPTDPKVIGKLKLPGYSTYLHPYDENYIIGVGKETSEDGYGNVKTQGVKVALFDVRDVTNPKLVDSMLLGSQYSDSAALRDHKAFLFSKEKHLLVLPISDHPDGYDWYGNRQPDVWNGAYALGVSETGFSKLGKVEHFSGRSSWYWGGEGEVQRSLYIDNVLYTISTTTIIGSDLSKDLKEVGTVHLPRDNDDPPPYYIYG